MENKSRKSISNIRALNEELLVEILCRVGGVKKAMQCKLVCKLWCSLVDNTDSSYFTQRWDQIHPVTLIASYELRFESPPPKYDPVETRYEFFAPPKEKEKKPLSMSLDFLPCERSNEKMCVLGCDKDLILCCPGLYDGHSCYYVCNPLTKQWTALPKVPEAFIDVGWQPKPGFLVHSDGKFTVVLMNPDEHVVDKQVLVFSSGWGGGWRWIGENSNVEIKFSSDYFKWRVAYKEKIVCLIEPDLNKNRENYICVMFDPRKGKQTHLPLPPSFPRIDPFVVGVIEGRLRFGGLVEGETRLIVWEFNDEDGRQEWYLMEMELGQALVSCKQLLAVAFHPHDGDVLYVLYAIWCEHRREDRFFIFSCNLNNCRIPTAVLVGEIPAPHEGYDFKLFVLEQQCWPTPIPLFSD